MKLIAEGMTTHSAENYPDNMHIVRRIKQPLFRLCVVTFFLLSRMSSFWHDCCCPYSVFTVCELERHNMGLLSYNAKRRKLINHHFGLINHHQGLINHHPQKCIFLKRPTLPKNVYFLGQSPE